MAHSVRILTVTLLGIVALASVGRVAAQQEEPAPFVIEFDRSLTFLADDGPIRAFIGLTECGSIDFEGAEWALVVGGPGAPAACNQAWRVVNLIPDIGGPLSNDPIFMPGQTVRITTISPFPGIDGPGGSPPFWIEVMVAEVFGAELAALQPLTAYVGGRNCGSASLGALADGPLIVPVGGPGTSDVCRERGTEITIVNAHGNPLVVRPSVGPGPFYRLTNLAPAPVSTGPPAPDNAQQLAPFTIEFDRSLSYLPTLEVIRAFMGATECGSLDFPDPDWTIPVGGPGTPEACNQPWRVVNLIPERNGLIAESPIFIPGDSVTLDDLTMFAFDGPPEPNFFIRAGDNLTPADIAALGSLTAEVGGIACGSPDPTDLEAGIFYLPVGASGTPDICRETGAEITLINDNDRSRLAVRLSVTPGFYVLTNLAVDPLGPSPAAAGSAGLASSAAASHDLELLLVVLGATILARRLTRREPADRA